MDFDKQSLVKNCNDKKGTTMELEEIRRKIDEIDAEILRLFEERLDVCAEIAAYKKENEKPVLDKIREVRKLESIEKQCQDKRNVYLAKALFEKIMELSRKRQTRIIEEGNEYWAVKVMKEKQNKINKGM